MHAYYSTAWRSRLAWLLGEAAGNVQRQGESAGSLRQRLWHCHPLRQAGRKGERSRLSGESSHETRARDDGDRNGTRLRSTALPPAFRGSGPPDRTVAVSPGQAVEQDGIAPIGNLRRNARLTTARRLPTCPT